MSAKELQDDWRKKKSDVMLKICHDLVNGDLEGFSLPPHIKSVVDFMLGENNEG